MWTPWWSPPSTRGWTTTPTSCPDSATPATASSVGCTSRADPQTSPVHPPEQGCRYCLSPMRLHRGRAVPDGTRMLSTAMERPHSRWPGNDVLPTWSSVYRHRRTQMVSRRAGVMDGGWERMGSLTELLKANGIDDPTSITSYSAVIDLATVLGRLDTISLGQAN